jgi:hypothetical protein
MPVLIEFKTSKFDPAAEPPNRINPIRGESILRWLRERVVPMATEPDAEDWGWYMEVEFSGCRYLIGSICHDSGAGASDALRDWMLQVHKRRSLTDKVLGRNKIHSADPLVQAIVTALRADPAFVQIEQHDDEH